MFFVYIYLDLPLKINHPWIGKYTKNMEILWEITFTSNQIDLPQVEDAYYHHCLKQLWKISTALPKSSQKLGVF